MDEFDRDSTRSSKVGQIIGIIICFVIIVGLSFALIFIKHEQRQFKAEIEETNKLINEQQNVISLIQKDIDSINDEIEENENIEKLVTDLKDQYPVLMSELESNIIQDKTDVKIAYLTFDDGPYKLTSSFLDVLDEYNVKGTFFALEKDEKYGYDEDVIEIFNSTYQRIISSGHTLGNHTSSHNIKRKNNGIYNSVDNFMDAILENREFIENNFGYTTTVMRFPGGSSIAAELKDEIVERLNAEHYGYVDWNSATGDGGDYVSVDQSIANVLETTNNRKFLVVLMHDYSENTLLALPSIIEGLQNQGYTILPLFYESTMVKKK